MLFRQAVFQRRLFPRETAPHVISIQFENGIFLPVYYFIIILTATISEAHFNLAHESMYNDAKCFQIFINIETKVHHIYCFRSE